MKTGQIHTKDETEEASWKELIQAIKPRNISINVYNGSVILNGVVDSYSKKLLIEQTVAGTVGVKSILNRVEVDLPIKNRKGDDELKDSIIRALSKDLNEPNDSFAMKIENDWLTIAGELENGKGEKILVKGKICRLEEVKNNNTFSQQSSNSASKELAYWEIFN